MVPAQMPRKFWRIENNFIKMPAFPDELYCGHPLGVVDLLPTDETQHFYGARNHLER
jgi:hypothetical protein